MAVANTAAMRLQESGNESGSVDVVAPEGKAGMIVIQQIGAKQ